jgi:hypothetical protein
MLVDEVFQLWHWMSYNYGTDEEVSSPRVTIREMWKYETYQKRTQTAMIETGNDSPQSTLFHARGKGKMLTKFQSENLKGRYVL